METESHLKYELDDNLIMDFEQASYLLSMIPAGQTAYVRSLHCDGQDMRLREMGLREGQKLEVLRAGNPMICRLGASRVGLCSKLADEIRVTTDRKPN